MSATRVLHHPAFYAALLALCAASFVEGVLPPQAAPGVMAPAPAPVEREAAFATAAAVLIPLLLGAGLAVGYVVLRAHNVLVFPRCEFPLAPWPGWHLLRAGIALFTFVRGVGIGLAWVRHLQEAEGWQRWLPAGLLPVAASNLTMLLACGFTMALVAAHGSPLSLLGLREPRPLRRALLGVTGFLMLYPLLYLARLVVETLAPRVGLPTQPPELLVQLAGVSPLASAVAFFGIVVVTPLAEEVFFRGFFYATLRRQLGPLGSILLSALVFAFLHSHLLGVVHLFLVGFLFAYLYERTGSLAASIAAHAAYNLYVLLLASLTIRS
ncbi:MAG: CPBP family intramembrane metalloprotease [Planctomycetes bacterium]|nr:CPBP family intramembrane metalloprotease [Planctomycetota bacterium]